MVTAERNGFTVEIRETPTGKLWMYVRTNPDGSPPSFEDWFDMIRALCRCELEKYSLDPDDPDEWERWTDMAKQFFLAAFERDATYADLKARFRLPR